MLVTGLRRWKMRQSRRSAHELTEGEKWLCPWNCGKFYRSTSSKSIQKHGTTCSNRAAKREVLPATNTIRAKREREETGKDGEEQNGEVLDDNKGEELQEMADSACNRRSGNTRMQATHQRTNTSSGRGALRLDNLLASSSSCSLFPADTMLTIPQHPTDRSNNTTAFAYSRDDHSSNSSPSTISTPSPSGSATFSPLSYDVWSSQKREVALQLQQLLRDIHRRHGTNHPVFQSRMMTQRFTDRLLYKDLDDAVECMGPERQHIATQSQPSLSVLVPEHASLLSSSTSFASSASSAPALSLAALHWTCACGSSFKITSGRSIQKHRAGCDTHRTTSQPMYEQRRQQTITQERRVKRQKH